MTNTSGFFSSATRDVPRDQWGRYKLPDADGNTSGWTQATTFAEALTEQFGLSIWKQRQVVYGLGKRPDLLALASTISGPEDKRALSEIVDAAHEAAATQFKANMGTAVHQACALAERSMTLDLGQRPDPLAAVPVEFREHVRGYLAAVRSAGFRIDPRYIERTVIVPEYHVAGTFDNAVVCPDGKYRILDKKTGNLDYAAIEFSVQLALYANAKAIRNYETNSYEPMPPNLATDYAVIAHIDLDTRLTTLYRVNIRQGWAWARLCAEVRDARQTKHVLTPLVTEVGLGAPEYAPVQPSGSQVITLDGSPLAHTVYTAQSVQLPPSPIQQATATAPDSFWDLPHDEDDDSGHPGVTVNEHGTGGVTVNEHPMPVASPPFTPPASAAAPVVASAPNMVGPTAESMPSSGSESTIVLPEDELDSLADSIVKGCKTKARLQQLARDTMAEASSRSGTEITETSPGGIKLSQYQIKIAKAVVLMSVRWNIPLPTFEKPRAAKTEATPEQTAEEKNTLLKLKMVRNCPSKQGLVEYRANIGDRWDDAFQNAARVRFAELDAIEKAAGGVPIGPAEMIAGATSPETLQIAWRKATNEGANPEGWTAELKSAAETRMDELTAKVSA